MGRPKGGKNVMRTPEEKEDSADQSGQSSRIPKSNKANPNKLNVI